MIDEVRRVFVAAADYTDECRVDVRMRRKHMDLSIAQARDFARELMDAAEEAQRAAASAVRPVEPAGIDLLGSLGESIARARIREVSGLPPEIVAQVREVAAEHGATVIETAELLSPDCAAGKHPHGWQDQAWNNAADVEVPCQCSCHTTGDAA